VFASSVANTEKCSSCLTLRGSFQVIVGGTGSLGRNLSAISLLSLSTILVHLVAYWQGSSNVVMGRMKRVLLVDNDDIG
jgi:hypothetical protein